MNNDRAKLKLTEKEAWAMIAKAYETKHEDRSSLQVRLAHEGFCAATYILKELEHISTRTCNHMLFKVRGLLLGKPSKWIAPTRCAGARGGWRKKHDKERAKLAREFAKGKWSDLTP